MKLVSRTGSEPGSANLFTLSPTSPRGQAGFIWEGGQGHWGPERKQASVLSPQVFPPKASLFRGMSCTLCEGECELMAAGGQWMGPENTYCGMGREAREFSSGKKMRSSADSVNYSERKQLYRRK